MNDLVLDQAQAVAELKKREFQKNPFICILQSLLKIKTKDGQFIPLRLKPIQEKILHCIVDLMSRDIPVRIWILKARQEGVSTMVEAIIYVLAAFRKNINALIISKDADQATTLFSMSKLYHEELKCKDPLLVPDLRKSNAKELIFDGTRSLIRIDTAKDTSAGRGDNYHLVHLSEIAFWTNASTLMTGLKQTVASLPGTIMIGETTANGLGGYFHEQWVRAEQGKSDWIPLFFAWFEDPTYSRFFVDDNERDLLLSTLGIHSNYNDFDGEETVLQEKYDCTLEQLNWRRSTIRNECDGDLDKFHQEYPSTPEEAFLVSGRPRFNVKILKKMHSVTSLPLVTGFLSHSPAALAPDLELNPKGYLKVWFMPVPGRRYVIGGDVAEGIMKNEANKESDYSCLHVLNRRTLEQVAVWHGRIDPDLLGLEAVKLARFYNDALIGIERNNSGLTTVTRIKNENYWNVYQSMVYDEVMDREEKKLGWVTSSKSKPFMIDDLARMIREHSIKINDPDTINECMVYVIDDDGKTNAQSGCHDDRVMALAIGVQMIRVYPDSREEEKKPEDILGTMEYWLKQNESQTGRSLI